MTQVIDLRAMRLAAGVKRGFRNWINQFHEHFGKDTRPSDLSLSTLSCLAQGKDEETFYFYDLIMNLKNLGSGFEFNELSSRNKMDVIDRYLVLLDRLRFECMRRLGWLEDYPGKELTLVELITDFDRLGPGLQADVPKLSRKHPDYEAYSAMVTLDKEAFIRRLIPDALREVEDYSTTL